MNLKYIRYNLSEVQEEIENILTRIKLGEGYSHSEFYSSMQHIFHHVNIAWNTRDIDEQITDQADECDLQKWSKTPSDITLI